MRYLILLLLPFFSQAAVVASIQKAPKGYTLTLTDAAKPVSWKALDLVHTKKIHLLLVDETLTDFQHVHPTPTKQAGVYAFDFKPKNVAYRGVVDITVAGKRHYLEPAPIASSAPALRLSTEKPLVAGGEGMITIHQLDKRLRAITPYLGACGHLAGFVRPANFAADSLSPIHAHPLNEDKCTFPLQFHVFPTKAGQLHLFLETIVDGTLQQYPFVVDVGNAP